MVRHFPSNFQGGGGGGGGSRRKGSGPGAPPVGVAPHPQGVRSGQTAGVCVAGDAQLAGAIVVAPHPQEVRGGQTAGDNGERGAAVEPAPAAIEQTATAAATAATEAARTAGAAAHSSRNCPTVMSPSRGSAWQ